MANEMRDKLYDLLGECEKKYSAYYEEFIKQLDNAGTQAEFEKIYDRVIKKHDFFADHLIENGVIVPKFKVGDRVWYITGIYGTIVKSAIVEEIIINCNGVSDLFVTSDTCSFENSVDIFYPTKEQAEQKLKEMRGGNDL